MTEIVTTADCHGQVQVPDRAVQILIPDDGTEPYYVFPCPICLSPQHKAMTNKIAALLTVAGVRVVHLADEVAEANDDAALDRFLGGA
jgi:hypothetical protein